MITGHFPFTVFSNAAESEKMMQCAESYASALLDRNTFSDFTGWVDPDVSQISTIDSIADEIRLSADAFVVIGIGGSNQAARAAISAIPNDGPDIIFAGNTLSAFEIAHTLKSLDKYNSIYINVIAKNYETLEPGSNFRVFLNYLKNRYGNDDLAHRIILTGTVGSLLERIAMEKQYRFLEFPVDVGGRFSAFSPVALLPIAVAGLDLAAYFSGAIAMYQEIRNNSSNDAVRYAVYRNLLYQQGFYIEALASFEPRLSYFSKWWTQLFGESEGKEGKGIFPMSLIYSEDLHSLGQYVQEGHRSLFETFLITEDPGASVLVPKNPLFNDAFDYLDNCDFAEINKIAESASIEAHKDGGVPCAEILLETIDEYHIGMLFYFFMFSSSVSGQLLKVNPFNQDGVEAYKKRMFSALKGKKNDQ